MDGCALSGSWPSPPAGARRRDALGQETGAFLFHSSPSLWLLRQGRERAEPIQPLIERGRVRWGWAMGEAPAGSACLLLLGCCCPKTTTKGERHGEGGRGKGRCNGDTRRDIERRFRGAAGEQRARTVLRVVSFPSLSLLCSSSSLATSAQRGWRWRRWRWRPCCAFSSDRVVLRFAALDRLRLLAVRMPGSTASSTTLATTPRRSPPHPTARAREGVEEGEEAFHSVFMRRPGRTAFIGKCLKSDGSCDCHLSSHRSSFSHALCASVPDSSSTTKYHMES